MQIISIKQTVRSDKTQDIKEFNSQCLAIQVKKKESN